MTRPDFEDAYLGDNTPDDSDSSVTGYVSEGTDEVDGPLLASGMPIEPPTVCESESSQFGSPRSTGSNS